MAVPIQKFREIVFQILYSQDIARATDEHMIELLCNELAVTKKTVKEAINRVHQLRSHQEEIDKLIAKTSISYEFERIQSVERNILRLGVFEILHDDNIPTKVAIAEAMRLARKFSTKESSSFINAILDAIQKSQLGEKIDSTTLKVTAEELIQSEKTAHQASLEKKEHSKDSEKE